MMEKFEIKLCNQCRNYQLEKTRQLIWNWIFFLKTAKKINKVQFDLSSSDFGIVLWQTALTTLMTSNRFTVLSHLVDKCKKKFELFSNMNVSIFDCGENSRGRILDLSDGEARARLLLFERAASNLFYRRVSTRRLWRLAWRHVRQRLCRHRPRRSTLHGLFRRHRQVKILHLLKPKAWIVHNVKIKFYRRKDQRWKDGLTCWWTLS